MTDLRRDEVRDAIAAAGLTCPNDDQIELLRGFVARRLIEFDGIRGSYRVQKVRKRSIRVKSYYFKDREGITFNKEGFVGFAGWADDVNVQPLLRAALDWVADVQVLPAALSGMVQPLVWVPDQRYPDEAMAGDYFIWNERNGYQVYFWSIVEGEPHPTLEAAKAAAQAHHVATIMQAFGVQGGEA